MAETFEHLDLSADEVLTTTRSVRKRLDLERPVPLEVITEALEVALQAPSGSNAQGWHWIVLTDPEPKRIVAEYYRKSYSAYAEAGAAARAAKPPKDLETAEKVASSATYLAEILEQVPALVIGAIHVPGGELPAGNQAQSWGSLLPAAWNFALALRVRGLGSAWTTLHLDYEREIAAALGIPVNVRQGVLLPVAYTKGTDFKPAKRAPLDTVLHINHW
ncbi:MULTISPECIES: nitroreductase family protein [Nocardia]|uniref:nitroreductase family protein n=1 Tax=Nocardia TaxID=1817 RepID=UPI0007EC2274|nr:MULTISPECIES: nitroreductase family protein [Nocardia]MBF6278653.1 nitroreductase family protein [Nocardia nova]OBA53393.1 nitroreductase [Nocardia sp. 852002-51101_SCH5132738]OBB50218.1 nitroreductase [Nocardia sp. 852002-51244_SCH5132740]OBF66690.1 nitroreductase [Mycobacterium sp. 852002-51759_SCH5129042]